MLDTILVILALWGFYNTKYFEEWSHVHIGGNQISFSLTNTCYFLFLFLCFCVLLVLFCFLL